MAQQRRISLLFFIGFFAAGSTALGYYYYFVYEPPIKVAEQFMNHLQNHDVKGLQDDIIVSTGLDSESLREPEPSDIQSLFLEPFERGRILDVRPREGRSRNFYYLVYREPDGRIFALVSTLFDGRYRVVIPEPQLSSKVHRYLWDYTWTN